MSRGLSTGPYRESRRTLKEMGTFKLNTRNKTHCINHRRSHNRRRLMPRIMLTREVKVLLLLRH